jgi:hypothetical protein
MSDWSPGLEVLPGLYQDPPPRWQGVRAPNSCTCFRTPEVRFTIVERIQKRQALERGLELGRDFTSLSSRGA